MEFISATKSQVFTPYGRQIKNKFPWYAQELCNEWPHQASALSFGESSVIKYALSYPRRTGLEAPEESDFPEFTQYFQVEDRSLYGQIEECFVSRGVCVLSTGPLGGPSRLKGLYRPHTSYGTGAGIRSVAKTCFPRDSDHDSHQRQKCNQDESNDGQHKDAYICLAEKAGISLYCEVSSENHVAYMPEFHIEQIMSCDFGLLVIPVRKSLNDTDSLDDRNMYILTHPIKQVSKIWIKRSPALDYEEYDSNAEKFLWCEKDLCIFWSLKHDRIILRRLVKLNKQDIMHSTTLNASTTASHFHTTHHNSTTEHSLPGTSRYLATPQQGNLNLYSPFRRSSQNSNTMRVNREGMSTYYWPSFDFGDSSLNNGLAIGFYPPHVCVYDDPEFYFRTLFTIELAKNNWKIPRKFQVVPIANSGGSRRIALLALVKTHLYVWSVEVESGKRLSHYAIKGVTDFSSSRGDQDGNGISSFLILLTTSGALKIGWLDEEYNIVCSTLLQHNLSDREQCVSILSVDHIFFGDTIVCTMMESSKNKEDHDVGEDKDKSKDSISEEKDKDASSSDSTSSTTTTTTTTTTGTVRTIRIQLKNYQKNALIRRCVEGFKLELTSQIVAKILAFYMEDGEEACFEEDWQNFVQIVENILANEPASQRAAIGEKMLRVIETLKENIKIYSSCAVYSTKLQEFAVSISKFLKEKTHKKQLPSRSTSLFHDFANLIMSTNPKTEPAYKKLPPVLQILLDSSDSISNLEELVAIQSTGAKFAPAIEILIADVFLRNQNKVRFDWPEAVIKAVGRVDYLSGSNALNHRLLGESKLSPSPTHPDSENSTEEVTWTSHVLNMRIFSEDRRLEEVCRLLDSASPLSIDVEQRAEMSDHEYVEEQEKHLLQLVQIAFSAPTGRAAFTLRTEEKNFANLTSHIYVPKLCFSGKCAVKGTTIDLNDSDLPTSYTAWPSFHNAVASAVSVRFSDSPADAWFVYNKTKTIEGTEQAGMVLGFGLNGILSAMPPTLRHEHLAKENSFTTMSMLLGLAANLAGTGDISTWKLISLHISAMLPACTTELEIPRFATLVAPCALGLLFLQTHNTHIAKVLLGEISKRYSPLSVFGNNSMNNSASNVNPTEFSLMAADREAHTLCAGFGLGFVNLGKGRLNNGNIEDGFDGILRRFVVGGPKPAHLVAEEEDLFSQYGNSLPSLWEEYRCCHIEEGDNVNVDVTTPSAIIAVALIYLRSGNEAVLKWLAPPSTLHLLDCVRPDLLMLRALASILVFEQVPDPDVNWLEDNLMPASLTKSALKQPEPNSKTDHESINQAWASIVCGYCLGLGICYAGTSDSQVKETLWHYTNMILNMSSVDSKLSEYFPKNFLESSACTLLISLALVSAGTGDVSILRLCRFLQSKVATTPITTTSNTYGFEMCISMATGILFLGGGRYSLSNDDKSIAVLLASVFPKWPINANDNRYHLQALRHLYILAAQPRLILPKPLPQSNEIKFHIEYLNDQVTVINAPVLLLPPFHLIKKIRLEDSEYLSIEFHLPEDLPHLKKIVEGGGVINLVSKPLSAIDHGFMKRMAWRENHSFHETFAIDDDLPVDERFEIKDLGLISRMAEWSGLQKCVPAFLALKYGDPKSEDWIWQLRILYWWVLRSQSRKQPCAIKFDILASLLTKADGQLDIFVSDSGKASE